MNDSVINVYKKRGETPLQCINNLKKNNPELKLLPMTYAGRLDPLAEGVLLILIGDECKKKEEYMNLGKVYEVDVLFGFETDTYDLMGLVNKTKELFSEDTSLENDRLEISSNIKNIIPNFIGKIKQLYPPYSSRPVNGRPLFEWAREGKLDEIKIPSHDISVESIEILEEREILGKDLLEKIKDDISKVGGDFRQKEIMAIWERELRSKYEEKYLIVKLIISCGSGAYMRVIANDIGKKLDIPALALNIKRIKVGEYTID